MFRGQSELPRRVSGSIRGGFGVNLNCYETHEILVLGRIRGLLRFFEVTSHPPPLKDSEVCMEGPGWAGRFRGQPDLPGRFRGQYEEGFGVNTTCYETHEILVLEGFGVF